MLGCLGRVGAAECEWWQDNPAVIADDTALVADSEE